jgi:hypothetical protein
MEFEPEEPPRRFTVGEGGRVTLADCGTVRLAPEELVTFRTESSAFDVTRKSFGYYALNSLNATLPRQGLRPALCANAGGQTFLLLVEPAAEGDYRAYLAGEGMRHLVWLDRTPPEALSTLATEEKGDG